MRRASDARLFDRGTLRFTRCGRNNYQGAQTTVVADNADVGVAAELRQSFLYAASGETRLRVVVPALLDRAADGLQTLQDGKRMRKVS